MKEPVNTYEYEMYGGEETDAIIGLMGFAITLGAVILWIVCFM